MKARIKFRKYGIMRFIGHLDVMRFFQKAMRRAEIPIAFTSGYSPHMIMSFAQPLGIGLTSDAEYMDIELSEAIPSSKAVQALNEVMTEGIEVLSFRQIAEDKKSSGMTIVAAADYLVALKEKKDIPPFWRESLEAFLSAPEILIVKKTKRSEKETDIRPLIHQMEIRPNGMYLKLAAGSEANLKPDLVMDAFYEKAGQEKKDLLHFHRLELYAKDSGGEAGQFCTLDSLGTDIV